MSGCCLMVMVLNGMVKEGLNKSARQVLPTRINVHFGDGDWRDATDDFGNARI